MNEAKGTAPERVWLNSKTLVSSDAYVYRDDRRTEDADVEYVRAELIEQLERWKREAMPLLTRYDDLAETFGGKLGSSKVANMEKGVAALRARVTQLERALRRSHNCATLRDDGTCDGCFVSAVLNNETVEVK